MKQSYSFVRRITINMILLYAILLIFMLVISMYNIKILHKNVYDQMDNALSQEISYIENAFNNAGFYMISYCSGSSDLNIMYKHEQNSEYYTSYFNMRKNLDSVIVSTSGIDGLFIFIPSSKQVITSSSSSIVAMDMIYLRSFLREQYSSEQLDSYLQLKWFPFQLNGNWYLIRLFRIGNYYSGVLTSFSTILSPLKEISELDIIPFYTYSKDYSDLLIDEHSQNLETSFSSVTNYSWGSYLTLENTRYLAASRKLLLSPEGSIYVLTPYKNIINQFISSYRLMVILLSLFLFIGLLILRNTYRSVQNAFTQLEDSLNALREGDFSIRLLENHNSTEFQAINTAFNQMIEQIEQLKINIYEEKLLQQKTELQALKTQLAPHFLINCLNSIYHMSANGKPNDLQRMTICLGNHLRYALADQSQVSLTEELTYVENYVELSLLRFPDCIRLMIQMSPTLENAEILPMSILFQVENIIKYEVSAGEITEIHIEITEQNTLLPSTPSKQGTHNYLHICIWDTGEGYDPSVLEQLNSVEMLSQSDGHNIGTKNTYRRLHLVFQQDFLMHFSNRHNAGAQIDMVFPYQIIKEVKS